MGAPSLLTARNLPQLRTLPPVARSTLEGIFQRCSSQLLHIENVLFPSTCEFISNKVFLGYIRYLTAWSLKARNRSFRSFGIIDRNSLESGSEGIGRFTGIPNGREPVSNGQTLPVAISFRLLLFEVCDPANCLVRAHDSVTCWRASGPAMNRLKSLGVSLLPSLLYSPEG
jgi:hypothetical protein